MRKIRIRNREMQVCTLSGMICPGRRWDNTVAHPFKITFKAYVLNHAKNTAQKKLKALIRREKEEHNVSKITLSGVAMRMGNAVFPLQRPFCNNSILYATRSSRPFN